MGNYDERLHQLTAVQHGIAGRDQLLDIGTRRHIDHRLRIGVIERLHQSAYRLTGAPESWRQDVMAACFAGGKSSVASFRTAAQLHYLPGGEEIVEITSLRHRRARHEGIIPHESRHLTDLDVMYVDNIPVTRAARTINDLGLLVERHELEAGVLDHAMHDAVRRDLVDVPRVWEEWKRLGGAFRPGGIAIEAMLRNFVPPLHNPDSSPELKLLQLIRGRGLPEPVPQFRVWISPTRWYDLDYAWPGLKLFAEFDPYKFHGNRDKYQKDAHRRLQVRALGWDGVSVVDDELDAGAPLAMLVLHQLMEKAS